MASKTIPTVPDPRADVFGMDAGATLGFVIERRRRQNVEAAEEMRAVTRWADLHRTDTVTWAAVDDDIAHSLPLGAPVEGHEGTLRLAGQGACGVEEFAVCELAAALGLSEITARSYVGQSLELRDRLPRCWAKVMSGDLPAWKARQIAEQTIPLEATTASYVDAQLAPFAHKLSLGRILKCVEAAVLRFQPDLAAERAAAAGDKRGVWAEHCAGGVSELRAVADTPDIAAVDATLDRVATTMGQLGDSDSHQARRAKALGVLADPQFAMDLLTDPVNAQASNTRGRPTMHVHLHTNSLAEHLTGTTSGVARVDGVGPQTIEAVTRWLSGLASGSTITLTPVVDLTTHVAVDAYEIPDRLRTQIAHRDSGCVFPWCGRRGRHDLDHIEPFDFGDPETGRPPPGGQTSTANLARLCRFHHRVKTHSNWQYRRRDPVTVEWTSPLGHSYIVDHSGTTNQT